MTSNERKRWSEKHDQIILAEWGHESGAASDSELGKKRTAIAETVGRSYTACRERYRQLTQFAHIAPATSPGTVIATDLDIANLNMRISDIESVLLELLEKAHEHSAASPLLTAAERIRQRGLK